MLDSTRDDLSAFSTVALPADVVASDPGSLATCWGDLDITRSSSACAMTKRRKAMLQTVDAAVQVFERAARDRRDVAVKHQLEKVDVETHGREEVLRVDAGSCVEVRR